MSGRSRKFSCKTASETLEWIHAIIDFITPYRFLVDAHVVNFFIDKLWEAVDNDWMDCLRNEPVENLLRIPSGVFQDHWPASLKEFVLTLKTLSFPRGQANLQEEFPGLRVTSLNSVLAQGMNRKKKHEIESLAAIVSFISKQVGSNTVVDVGAGQGYLAQVLSFQYELSVFAIDACLHHGKITDARAERIRKHYAAKMRKSGSKDRELCVPQTVTCRVLSSNSLKTLNNSLSEKDNIQPPNININGDEVHCTKGPDESDASCNSSLVLAGLHACGDLSVTMLRTFLECDKVRSVVSIGCCYNLLSEGSNDVISSLCGFPMSDGVKTTGLELGRNARDLACQSAERWGSLGEDAGLHNFELHAFRAAFQMVLARHNPESLTKSPSIGRQGKALRRQQNQKILESSLGKESCIIFLFSPVLQILPDQVSLSNKK
ncbi:OLC1v1022309C4 [Oldenlandia corymbosa var. corymbosa]|uniref:OLC1v1022309C4 n=1 Tax=Oldenlandia corymbosa var. corymbosa TaxID=529605 RepID=A0AAV1BZ72_OLDCO|nr:OLC1v1022309C4 [Oldenlandia corymbosa var. corymbosa]